MKIFVSSVVRGFEPYRDAAHRAIASLGLQVLRSERLTASPESPRCACLAEVRAADAVVLLLGERYGSIQESGLSATHEEYRDARERCPVFVLVQDGHSMESRQREFIREVQEWESGCVTGRFGDPDTLRDQVTQALHRWQIAQSARAVDVVELRGRTQRFLPERGSYSEARIATITVGGPYQTILRPVQLEGRAFRRELQREAAFGTRAVLDPDAETKTAIRNDLLVFEQSQNSLLLAPDGTVRIMFAAREPDAERNVVSVILEEYVQERLGNALAFASDLLDRIDPTHKLAEILPIVLCLNAGHSGWRTRDEHRASPHSITLGSRGHESIEVELDPPLLKRGTFRQQGDRLAEDFTVLLRRRLKP